MKAQLTYDLPEEEKDHLRAVKSEDLALALFDIEQYLRGVEKHETGDSIERIREQVCRILDKYDINLDNLLE